MATSAMGCSGPDCTSSYCASRRLYDGGFGYDQADPPDPAATVAVTPTTGNLRVYYLYPTARPGATMPVFNPAGTTVLGYAMNLSGCAPDCLCDEVQVSGAVTPDATNTVKGKTSYAVGSEYPSITDAEATTPNYVSAAINAIPDAGPVTRGLTTLVNTAPSTSTTAAATPAFVNAAIAALPLGSIAVATDTVQGKVALAVGANFPADNNAPANDVDATTPAYVKLAIAAALAAASVILLANDGSTVLGLILPATTTPSAATIQLLSNDGATILGYVNV
jgi:hypothetical protein